MKVAFTGTQAGMTDAQKRILTTALSFLKPSAFIHGGCIGADDEADLIAAGLGILRIVYPSNIQAKSVPSDILKWRGSCIVLPEAPPLERNERIVVSADMLIACPKTAKEQLRSGTWATVRRARKLIGYKKGTYKIEVIEP